MYNSILRQIANTIYINVQNVEYLGLLKGKFGIALFFYHYARYSGNNIYSEFSDDCIENIFTQLNQNTPKDFSNGLCGIGWGIDYLIKNNFIEAESDILAEVDLNVKKMGLNDFKSDLDAEINFFSKGLYILQREDIESIRETILLCKDFLHENKNLLSLAYLNSVIYFIVKSISLNIEPEQCKELLDRLYIYIADIINNKKYIDAEIALLRRYINEFDCSERVKQWQDLLPGENIHLNILGRSWTNLIYPFSNIFEETMIDPIILEELLKTKIQELESSDLSVYNGLAGLGIELIRISQIYGN
ncbi:lanthionine synthetase LanC family protein [Dysgonomonas sp. ZJ279]|uniref:lanthionine synthetase LanC family protein n=1 Tax=Dysgonomonas sp. ZJ279 TaxID=2709796 RepID=UPI0013EB2DBC|nr:lanthionine synthetase LanC family protein [Dysgonomonas sp. ZJ279]